MNTRSFIFEPDDIQSSLIKLKFSENLTMKIYSLDEILNFYQIYLDASLKESTNKNSYMHKSPTYRKISQVGSSNPSINFFNFLNNLPSDSNQSIIGTNRDQGNHKINSSRRPTLVNSNHNTNYMSNLSKMGQTKIQNNLSSQNHNFFNIRLKNLCEMVNKSIKDMNNNSILQHHNSISIHNSSEKIKESTSNNLNNIMTSAGKYNIFYYNQLLNSRLK